MASQNAKFVCLVSIQHGLTIQHWLSFSLKSPVLHHATNKNSYVNVVSVLLENATGENDKIHNAKPLGSLGSNNSILFRSYKHSVQIRMFSPNEKRELLE